MLGLNAGAALHNPNTLKSPGQIPNTCAKTIFCPISLVISEPEIQEFKSLSPKYNARYPIPEKSEPMPALAMLAFARTTFPR